MNGRVGVTDRSWFAFLSVRAPDEGSFRQTSSGRCVTGLEAGVHFLFKLHAPDLSGKIVAGIVPRRFRRHVPSELLHDFEERADS